MTDKTRSADAGTGDVGGKVEHLWIRWILLSIVVYAIAMVGFGVYLPSRLSWSDAGSFGDMFGAFSAFASGLSLSGVVVAIILQYRQISIQRLELELQREELRLQRDEMTKSRKELMKQTYISALAARVGALASLKELGELASELYATNETLKDHLDDLAREISDEAPLVPGRLSASKGEM